MPIVKGGGSLAATRPTRVPVASVVEVARGRIREYFEAKGADLHKATEQRAKL